MLPPNERESHLILKIPIKESSFRVIVEPSSAIPLNKFPISWIQGGQALDDDRTLEKVGRPATMKDLMTVLSNVERFLIKAKYINDQTTTEYVDIDEVFFLDCSIKTYNCID